MSVDCGNEQVRPAPPHRITWFSPERPVDGTVFVRPEPATSGIGPAQPEIPSGR